MRNQIKREYTIYMYNFVNSQIPPGWQRAPLVLVYREASTEGRGLSVLVVLMVEMVVCSQ